MIIFCIISRYGSEYPQGLEVFGDVQRLHRGDGRSLAHLEEIAATERHSVLLDLVVLLLAVGGAV